MKLVRYGAKGRENPGIVDGHGRVRDLSAYVPDIAGGALSQTGLAAIKALDIESLPLVADDIRLGPCVGGVGKILCIGLNYHDHARETGRPTPEEPMLFMKATSALGGAYDDVHMPRTSSEVDHEAELAVVIGTAAKYVAKELALSHVAGYAIINDVSERVFQNKRGGQFTKGKSCDGFAPLGPWLVTADEIPDPQNLAVKLSVEGSLRQNGTTSDMVFDVATLISYLSEMFTLHPGDIIATGTPAGVAAAMTPPAFLQHGQRVHIEIDGLGFQETRFLKDMPA